MSRVGLQEDDNLSSERRMERGAHFRAMWHQTTRERDALGVDQEVWTMAGHRIGGWSNGTQEGAVSGGRASRCLLLDPRKSSRSARRVTSMRQDILKQSMNTSGTRVAEFHESITKFTQVFTENRVSHGAFYGSVRQRKRMCQKKRRGQFRRNLI